MNEIYNEIVEIIDPIDGPDSISMDTVIADCEDIDSLALFNIVVFLKSHGFKGSVADLSKCETIADLVSLAQD